MANSQGMNVSSGIEMERKKYPGKGGKNNTGNTAIPVTRSKEKGGNQYRGPGFQSLFLKYCKEVPSEEQFFTVPGKQRCKK